jgi:hypothetical protein
MALFRSSGWFAKLVRQNRSGAGPSKRPAVRRLFIEQLEELNLLSTLDITGGSLTYTASPSINNALTISLTGGTPATTYNFNDTGETITLTPSAIAAGWTGGGTNTVSGPIASVTTNLAVNLLTGADQLNVNGAINVGPSGPATPGGAVALTAANIQLAAGVTSAGNQAYTGSVTLAANVTLTSSANGNVTFSSTVQSPGTAFALAVNTGGATTFSGALGGNGNFLGGLTTNNTGTTQINGGSVNSTSQTYGDTVTLGATPTTLTGNVTFQGNLILGPAAAAATITLQITGNLTLVNTATLTSTLTGTATSQYGHVVVSGTTNFGNSNLSLNYSNFSPVNGNAFDLVGNGATPLGQFTNATSPGPVKLSGVTYLVSYAGGSTGNDLVLTTVTPPVIISPASTKFTINSAGTFTVTATGTSPITFKQTGTLPKGVTFTASTGVLSGTPTAFGTFNFTFTATNSAGSTTQNFTLVISGIPAGATTPNQRFISQVYIDLLNRVVDTAGLAAWTNQLTLGVARSQVVLQIETSPSNEYRTAEVQALYQRYLNRNADPGGLAASVALLTHGGTIQQLSAALTSSAEFFGLAGSSNTGFLVLLYQDALQRAIDANSLTALSLGMALGTASRPTISHFVFSSPEFTNDLVQSIYQNYLHRSADPQGLAFNAQTIANGATYEQVTAFVMGSPEFFLNDVGP